MSSTPVAVNIVRRSDPHALHSSKTRCFINLDGTVAELREALLQDQVILPTDKFYIDGRALAKTSEKYTKWTDILREILVMGSDSPRVSEERYDQPYLTCQHHMHAPSSFVPPKYKDILTNDLDVSETKTFVNSPTGTVQRITCIHQYDVPVEPTQPVVKDVTLKPVVDEPVPEPIVTTAACLCDACQGTVSPVLPAADIPETIEPTLDVPKQDEVIIIDEPEVVIEVPVETVEVVVQEPVVIDEPIFCEPTIVCEFPPQPEPVEIDVVEIVKPADTFCPCDACITRAKIPAEEPPAPVDEPLPPAEEPVPEVDTSISVERDLFEFYKGCLGAGIDIYEPTGPNAPVLHAVGQITMADVEIEMLDSEIDEIVVTASSRVSAYAKAQWEKSCLSIQHPWVEDTVVVEETIVTEGIEASITGRHIHAKCKLSVSDDLRPHPDLKQAVDDALAVACYTERSRLLGEVFRKYGHYYVASIELGGMKHTTCARQVLTNETAESLENDMRAALEKLFGAEDMGCPCDECEQGALKFENETFETIGGSTQLLGENDTTEWKVSLSDPVNWSITRMLRAEPVINLFDEETRQKILAFAPGAFTEPPPVVEAPPLPTAPLHRLYCPKTGEHYYTTRPKEMDKALRLFGYTDEGLAATILSTQLEDTVPLYRMRETKKHRYSTTAAKGTVPKGTVGYVYLDQVDGTVPLYRLFYPHSEDYLLTVDVEERDVLLAGGWKDDGLACYVYPC